VGILQTKDYLQLLLKKAPPEIGAVMKLTYDVPPEIRLNELFEGLGRRRTHMAIVINESGNALGFVTMEDILEELVGEIYDEDDASERKGAGA
jgi:CBS domain containing-hemolysin-like protein